MATFDSAWKAEMIVKLHGDPPVRNNPAILAGKYTRKEFLGNGAEGQVYKVVDRQGTVFALKQIRRRRLGEFDDLDTPAFVDEILEMRHNSMEEARMLANLNHRHIVRLHEELDGSLGPPYAAMVLEYCGPYTMWDLARGSAGGLRADDETIWTAFCQITQALAYLADKGVVHGDFFVKPLNILLNVDTTRTSSRHPRGLVFKLGDFGHSARYSELVRRLTFIGTPLLYSPEVRLNGTGLTPASDIWSLFVSCLICLEVDTMAVLWRVPENTSQTSSGLQNLSNEHRRIAENDPRFAPFSDCLEELPANRPTAAELVRRQADYISFGVPMLDKRRRDGQRLRY